MTVLIWGLGDDPQITSVRRELRALGVPCALLDQRAGYEGVERADARRTLALEATLDAATAAYVRSWDALDIPEVRALSPPRRQERLEVEAYLWAWLHGTGITVVNRPTAGESNCSKPLQQALIAAYGFSVPETLVTTDAAVAWEFVAAHRRVAYKSISARRSVVACLSAGDDSSALRERLRSVSWCPTQLQRWIPGTDYRVHVIGAAAYACEIASDAVDYRYDGQATLRSAEIPPAELQRCVQLTRGLGLTLGGVDLRHGTDGQWYCFEVNPCPAFSYYEQETGLPLSRALASLLTEAAEMAP
jgi:glutathione synthase/RimK-type ligase-like ATP-grasp enzyme